MLMQIIMAFLATLSVSCLFNSPKQELLFSGLAGMCSWLVYQLAITYGFSAVTGTFLASMAVTFICRKLVFIRRMPLTVYLIPGIIPLVPGAGIYNTMYGIIINEPIQAAATGIETMKLAGVIAIGIILILSLPARVFHSQQMKIY